MRRRRSIYTHFSGAGEVLIYIYLAPERPEKYLYTPILSFILFTTMQMFWAIMISLPVSTGLSFQRQSRYNSKIQRKSTLLEICLQYFLKNYSLGFYVLNYNLKYSNYF